MTLIPPPPDGMPVLVDLRSARLAADVVAHVESVLGWQAVADGPHLPARLRIGDEPDGRLPTVVVAEDPSPATVRAATAAGALDVLAWPADAARLPRLVPARTPRRPAATIIVVSGAAGGVGTSTVALALAADHAWAGRRVDVVTDPAGASLARALMVDQDGRTTVSNLSVTVDGAGSRAGSPPLDVLVVDRGDGGSGQVLVARPDRRLAEVVAADRADTIRAVVVVGDGGLRADEVRQVLAGRPHLLVPWSFRIARAGLLGRVPQGLPGSHLRDVARMAARAGVGSAAHTGAAA